MANPTYYKNINYALNQPLNGTPPFPIISKLRAPTTKDIGYPLTTIWDYTATNSLYILASVVANVATWVAITAGGGSGTFTALVVTGTSTLTGTTNINTTGAATTSIGTGGTGAVNIGNATGNTAVTGNMTATGTITGSTLYASGDAGGVAAENALSNVSVPVAGGTGAFTITSATTSGAATNAGFIKMYVGTTAVYVPYYTTTA